MSGNEMPRALESEVALLSAMLFDAEAAREARDLVRPEDFYRERHARIFSAIAAIVERGDVPDVALVVDQLRTAGELEAAGGPQYLSKLLDAISTAAGLESNARRIQEAATLRRLIRAHQAGIEEARDAEAGKARAVLDAAESRVLNVAEGLSATSGDYHRAPELVDAVLQRWDEAEHNPGAVTGLSTGFPDLDRMTSGLEPGALWVVAGRPSMGKTALALDVARHGALRKGAAVTFASLEMPKEQVMGRLLCAEARAPYQKVTRGRASDVDARNISEAVGRVKGATFNVISPATLDLYALRSRARRIKSREGLDLLVVDYLQLMDGSTDAGNREQEVASLSRGLKALALELEIPVVALSQLSRAPENRPGSNRPRLSDLRESGAIEQDADVVLFVFRKERYVDPTDERFREVQGKAEIIVGKQRNGPTGTVDLYFRHDAITFDSPARQEEAA